jgi:hypothetical protein
VGSVREATDRADGVGIHDSRDAVAQPELRKYAPDLQVHTPKDVRRNRGKIVPETVVAVGQAT